MTPARDIPKLIDAVVAESNYDRDEWGNCNEINASVAYALTELGMKVKPVVGYVTLDQPLPPEEDEDSDGVYDPRHFWIEASGKIIDFAVKQFDGFLDLAKGRDFIWIERIPCYHRTESIKTDNEWVDQKLVAEILKKVGFRKKAESRYRIVFMG